MRIAFDEAALRQRIEAGGGRWPKMDKLWQLPYQTAVSLGLEHRIAKR